MLRLQHLFEAWTESHRELQIALHGLTDQHLWTRPHQNLLSIGELAGHIAFCEAALVTKRWDAQSRTEPIPISSPLVDHRFGYYTSILHEPVALVLSAADLATEISSVHDRASQIVFDLDPSGKDLANGSDRATWENVLQYMGFHVAYHTGQIYAVRHLLGHETEDN